MKLNKDHFYLEVTEAELVRLINRLSDAIAYELENNWYALAKDAQDLREQLRNIRKELPF